MFEAMFPVIPRACLRLPRSFWTWFVCILLVAVSIVVWLGIRVALPIYRREAAKRVFEERGVGYETVYNGPAWLDRPPWKSRCQSMRAWFDDVTSVTYASDFGLKHTDSDLAPIRFFPELESLYAMDTDFTDAGLANLSGLQKLDLLRIIDTPIGDAGLVHLKQLTQIRSLQLSGTKITEAGLEHFEAMKDLEWLDLPPIQLTDAGLSYLRRILETRNFEGLSVSTSAPNGEWTQLVSYRGLNLSDSSVTDNGVRQLEEIANLDALNLAGTRITDAGVSVLGRLTALTDLDLSRTQITGKGLAHLREIDRLQRLILSQTDLGDEDMRELPFVGAELDLSGTRVTNDGLALANLLPPYRLNLADTKVEDPSVFDQPRWLEASELNLDGTLISDSSMYQFKLLPHLTWISLKKTRVTPVGIAELQKAKPRLKINVPSD